MLAFFVKLWNIFAKWSVLNEHDANEKSLVLPEWCIVSIIYGGFLTFPKYQNIDGNIFIIYVLLWKLFTNGVSSWMIYCVLTRNKAVWL